MTNLGLWRLQIRLQGLVQKHKGSEVVKNSVNRIKAANMNGRIVAGLYYSCPAVAFFPDP